MKKNTLRHSLLLLLTAAIWGFAFVAQSVGMDYVQPFYLYCCPLTDRGDRTASVYFYPGAENRPDF